MDVAVTSVLNWKWSTNIESNRSVNRLWYCDGEVCCKSSIYGNTRQQRYTFVEGELKRKTYKCSL